MAKNRNAKAKAQRQKEQRANEIKKEHLEQRKRYFSRLDLLLKQLGYEYTKKYFDLGDWECIFRFRQSAIIYRLKGEKKPTLTCNDVEEAAKRFLNSLLESCTYTYTNGATITAYDVFYTLESYSYMIGAKVRLDGPYQEEVERELMPLKVFLDECLADILGKIEFWLLFASHIVSIPTVENIVFLTESYVKDSSADEDFSFSSSYTKKFYVYYEVKPCESVELSDGKRKGWYYPYEVHEISTINPIQIKVNGKPFGLSKTKMVPIYFKAHALQRLSERLDTLPVPTSLYLMRYWLMTNLEVIKVGSSKYLCPVVISNIKLGYFAIQATHNALLVKTFLFITNSSTPEGDLLDLNTGFHKIDKQFLKIDKLSTIVALNEKKNPEIVSIFESASLGYLFTLNEDMLNIFKMVSSSKDNSDAIIDYFRKRDDLLQSYTFEDDYDADEAKPKLVEALMASPNDHLKVSSSLQNEGMQEP